MHNDLIIHFIHIAGMWLIAQDTVGLSQGLPYQGTLEDGICATVHFFAPICFGMKTNLTGQLGTWMVWSGGGFWVAQTWRMVPVRTFCMKMSKHGSVASGNIHTQTLPAHEFVCCTLPDDHVLEKTAQQNMWFGVYCTCWNGHSAFLKVWFFDCWSFSSFSQRFPLELVRGTNGGPSGLDACEVIAGWSWGLIRASGSYGKSIGRGFL